MTNSVSFDTDEISFISGVTTSGTVAPYSYWTWDHDANPTFNSDAEAKWGSSVAGVGATITYNFAASADFSASEQSAFIATMALWSAVSNVTFENVGAAGAEVTISRDSSGVAEGGITSFHPGVVGATALGQAVSGSIQIDTNVAGFGPIGGSLSDYGGYPWMTLLHEEGHVLGLGHAGAYNEGQSGLAIDFRSDGSREASLMSYDGPDTGANWGESLGDDGQEYTGVPTTPMAYDIAAVQELYGLPTTTPLSGGQTFGFHSNISGPVEQFFNFNINTKPVITIWDAGTGNTLDVSGYSQNQNIDLQQGGASDIGGLSENVVIAFGARIDQAIGGLGNDTILGNADGDTLIGGLGDDKIISGVGSNQIYGGQGNDQIIGLGSDTIFAGQGDDTITGGPGNSFVSGDDGNDHISLTLVFGADTAYGGSGNDVIQGSDGPDALYGNAGNDTINLNAAGTIFGGQGNDLLITGDAGAHYISADLGDDTIKSISLAGDSLFGGQGNDIIIAVDNATIFGGQGDDLIKASGGSTSHHLLSGDLGNDTIIDTSSGGDTISGGAGADSITVNTGRTAREGDLFLVHSGESAVTADENNIDHITGFITGVDHIAISGHNAIVPTGVGQNIVFFDDSANHPASLSTESAAYQAASAYAANPSHFGLSFEYLEVEEAYNGTPVLYVFGHDGLALALVGQGGPLSSGDIVAGS